MNPFLHPIFYPYFEKYPLRFVDVGASGGIPSHWECVRRFLHTIAFEPDPREFESLKRNADVRTTYINAALHREKTTADFYLTQKQEVSSLLFPNRKFLDQFPEASRFDVRGKITIEVDMLDHQLKQAGIFDVDFIKLDTQGSELEILKGSSKTLAHTFGIEVEVEFTELYKDQPRFSEVEQFLRQYGFQLFDLRPYWWKRAQGANYGEGKGQLVFGEALFFKDINRMDDLLETSKDMETIKIRLLHAIAICLIYGYVDYAVEFFGLGKDYWSDEENQQFSRLLGKTIMWHRKIPARRLRNKLALMLVRASEVIEHHGWAKAGRPLGNNTSH